MKAVKQNIIAQLQSILLECNNADQADTDFANDLDPINSRQVSAYGHVSNALSTIAGDAAVDYFIENGEFGSEYEVAFSTMSDEQRIDRDDALDALAIAEFDTLVQCHDIRNFNDAFYIANCINRVDSTPARLAVAQTTMIGDAHTLRVGGDNAHQHHNALTFARIINHRSARGYQSCNGASSKQEYVIRWLEANNLSTNPSMIILLTKAYENFPL